MKKIMIIGAGKAQVPLIEAARNENYYTVVCDINKNAPGIIQADEYLKVSTKDRAALLKAAKDNNVDGIVANSEYAMCDVAHVANELGLIGNPEKAIEVLSSKTRFRELQKRIGLFTPKHIRVNSEKDLIRNSLSFPIIIKPDMSSGSRGTTVVRDANASDEIKRAIIRCISVSRNGSAVIEESVTMPSLTVVEGEVFVCNEKIIWDGLFSTIRSKSNPTIPMTYVFPIQEDKKRVDDLKTALEKIFHETGVVFGEYNIEAYFTKNEDPFVIEINPRQGGNELPKYVQEHCNINYYRLLVTTSMGDNYYLDSLGNNRRDNRFIVHHMLYPQKSGRFKGVSVSDEMSEYVYNKEFYICKGNEINKTVDASSCIGYIDFCFPNIEKQKKLSSHIEELVMINYEQG